jgi:hypothetical protein
LAREDPLRRLAAEELESTREVGDARHQQEPRHVAKHGAEALAQSRLVTRDVRARSPPRPDHRVRPLAETRQEAIDVVDRDGEIRVGEEHRVASRVEHSASHGKALAAVARLSIHAKRETDLCGDPLRRFRGPIATSVVDHERLGLAASIAEVGGDAAERSLDALRLVVRGDHDRERRRARARRFSKGGHLPILAASAARGSYGRRSNQGRSCSSCEASRKSVASSPKRPVNCVPIGSPAPFQKSGTLIAGR